MPRVQELARVTAKQALKEETPGGRAWFVWSLVQQKMSSGEVESEPYFNPRIGRQGRKAHVVVASIIDALWHEHVHDVPDEEKQAFSIPIHQFLRNSHNAMYFTRERVWWFADEFNNAGAKMPETKRMLTVTPMSRAEAKLTTHEAGEDRPPAKVVVINPPKQEDSHQEATVTAPATKRRVLMDEVISAIERGYNTRILIADQLDIADSTVHALLKEMVAEDRVVMDTRVTRNNRFYLPGTKLPEEPVADPTPVPNRTGLSNPNHQVSKGILNSIRLVLKTKRASGIENGWMTLEQLSKESGYSRSSCGDAVRYLVDSGEVVRERDGRYWLHQWVDTEHVAPETAVVRGEPGKAVLTTEGRALLQPELPIEQPTSTTHSGRGGLDLSDDVLAIARSIQSLLGDAPGTAALEARVSELEKELEKQKAINRVLMD